MTIDAREGRMVGMPKLTNGLLLGLIGLVLLWVGVAAVFSPFDSASELLAYFAFIAATGFLGGVIAAIVEARPGRKESIWSKPPSQRTGTLLINSVVFIFLCGIGILTFLLLQAKGSSGTVTGAILALFAGAGLGRYLQKRFSSRSLLPYGLSFFGAFVVMLITFAATKATA
jgi:peptidoglycan/LPS O-acetylase OafA/YrhL